LPARRVLTSESLEALLAERFDGEDADVGTVLSEVVRLFRTTCVKGAAPSDRDGDMLLFQYGAYDNGEGGVL